MAPTSSRFISWRFDISGTSTFFAAADATVRGAAAARGALRELRAAASGFALQPNFTGASCIASGRGVLCARERQGVLHPSQTLIYVFFIRAALARGALRLNAR